MSCTKHQWTKLLDTGSNDYDPGYAVYWCKVCGDASRQQYFDNRILKTVSFKREVPDASV